MSRKNRITNETWEALAKRYQKPDVSPTFDVTLTVRQSQMIRIAICKTIGRLEDDYEFLDTPSDRMQFACIMQEYKDIADLMRDTMYGAVGVNKENIRK